MENIEIELIFKPEIYESFFYSNGRDSLLFYPGLKLRSITGIIIGSMLIVSVFMNLGDKPDWALPITLGIIFIIIGMNVMQAVKKIMHWKKEVQKFIQDLSESKTRKFIFSDLSISYIQDQVETIETWDSISNVSIRNDYIRLKGLNDILILKATITNDEYEIVKNFISEKMKNKG